MLFRVLTLPFDAVLEGFPDEIVQEFCINKQVHKMDAHFFMQDGKPFWSIAIHYEVLLKEKRKTHALDEVQKLLYERLREWRKTVGMQAGVPVYIVATNAHLLEITQRRPASMEAMKPIKGFGRARIDKYGRQIIHIIKVFYEENVQKPKEDEETKLPF